VKVAALVEEIEARVEGLPVRNAPALRGLRRAYSKRVEALAPRDVVTIATALIARRRVHRFIGDELIASHPDAFASLDLAQLEQLGSGISSWDQVDSFACILSGPAWREGHIEDHAIERWAKSKDRWALRALVAQDPNAVRRFIGTNEARLAALVRREVLHKLGTGRKNPKPSRWNVSRDAAL